MSSYGLWLSAGGMKVNEHRQTLLANNMANMQTTGFKSDLAMITQNRHAARGGRPDGRTASHPVLDQLPGGLQVMPPHHSLAQGPIESTGRALDLAIDGPGFFVVGHDDVRRYTRDGGFTSNPEGELVLSADEGQWRVLDELGNPIAIDEAAGAPVVSEDGTIRQAGVVVGQVAIVDFADRAALRKEGANLFELKSEQEPVEADARIAPESLEGSNFDVMSGLAGMIEAARAYQMNATMLQLQDQATGQAVGTVGRLA